MRTIRCFLLLAAVWLSLTARAQQPVTFSEVNEVIPTYKSNPPEPNPMFFFGRGTQGAEQRIYPYPLYDNLTNRKSNQTYQLLYLENEYVKIGVMPELGGRLFSAVDKTNNYDFIYRQHVIKPALIGLTGAWISGGVEWNIPHHHRASTFIPVQWQLETHTDGSKTIWVGELEVRHRMRWAVGYTLRPGSSIVECSIRINNRTPVENTMLCFANIAVSVNDDYQVIFPPSTQWSTGHSKRSFQPWPVTNNVDVSWYKNNKSSNSWFAVNYDDDFVAGYDHGKDAGIMSVADHNIVAGKKFFTWGVGNMWDKILTDDDGPYLEIMVGAYSDNQPDYSWLQPSEGRSFDISLFPFRGIQGVKNANLDAAVNLEVKEGEANLGFYTTKAWSDAVVTLKAGNKILSEERVAISPAKPYSKKIALVAGQNEQELRASISVAGRELVAYEPMALVPTPKPVGTSNPAAPEEIENAEELFLAGQRIDQFHNPSLDADPYWEELLSRDSLNIEANTGMARLALRNAKYALAERYLNRAIQRLTAQYTIPKNAEPFYYLGVALQAQGRLDEAFTAYFKAAWKQEWKAPAYYGLAEIATFQKNYTRGLDLVSQSLDANASNVRAYVLKSALLRALNRSDEAAKVVAFAMDKCDRLDAQLMAELWLASKEAKAAQTLFSTLKEHPINAQEIAAGYFGCGLWNDGQVVLSQLVSETADTKTLSPLIYYYLGYFAEKLGDTQKADDFRKQAVLQPFDYVFPFQQELIAVLQRAIEANPSDARAPYYLGNLLYDWQPEEAIRFWELSAKIDPSLPITWRNLAIAYSHRQEEGAKGKAIAALERAVAAPNPYPAHFAELEQLYKAEGVLVEKRLALLEANQKVVMQKDEALGALIQLKIFAGKTDEAIELLKGRVFSIWEGGNAFNTGQAWADAHLRRGLHNYAKKRYREALADFQVAGSPPENLRAQGGRNARQTQLAYYIGCAYEALGEKAKAAASWNEVVGTGSQSAQGQGFGGGSRRGFGANSQEQRYYVALAQKKLGIKSDTESVFRELAGIGTSAVAVAAANEGDPQFIAARRMPSRDNQALPLYIKGLGYAGLGDSARAREAFNAALAASPDYLSARIALEQL
ncbi:MAG: DUF5107 domain-containing protein [Bacteroidales bacterium]